MELLAIGIEHAGQLLVTAGHNPERLCGEAAFAHLYGAAPIAASSGRTGWTAAAIATPTACCTWPW